MPSISKYTRSTWGLFVKFYRAISGAIGTFTRAVRERWSVLTVTILGICVPFYSMAWWLNIHDNLAAEIGVTAVVTAFPVTALLSPPEPLTARSYPVWFSVFSLFTLALFIGDEYDWQLLSFSVILVLIALPYGLVFGFIVRHEWLLSVGFALALLATMIYWSASLAISAEGFDLLLVPLPIILAGGVLWAPLASWTLKSARRHKNRRILGPGMQALAMTMLFFPVTLVAIALPSDMGLNETWSNLSVALIGIFLSAVISEPLRRFLIEWGNLSPNQKASASSVSTDHLPSRDPQEDD